VFILNKYLEQQYTQHFWDYLTSTSDGFAGRTNLPTQLEPCFNSLPNPRHTATTRPSLCVYPWMDYHYRFEFIFSTFSAELGMPIQVLTSQITCTCQVVNIFSFCWIYTVIISWQNCFHRYSVTHADYLAWMKPEIICTTSTIHNNSTMKRC